MMEHTDDFERTTGFRSTMNAVELHGTIGQVQISQLKNGGTMVKFKLTQTDNSSETVSETVFELVAFGKTAEFLAQHGERAVKSKVFGVLRPSTYTDKNGVERISLSVVAQRIEVLTWGMSASDRSYGQSAYRDAVRRREEREMLAWKMGY